MTPVGRLPFCLAALTIAVATSCASVRVKTETTAAHAVAYPAARTAPVSETHFGITTVDPYRWMEEGGPEFTDWLTAENRFARAHLDRLPARQRFESRLRELSGGLDSIADLKASDDGTLFFLRRSGGSETYALWMKRSDSSEERCLVDLDQSAKHRSIDFFTPSPDGALVAYGIAENGSENSILRIFDVKAGRALPQEGPRMQYERVAWLNKSEFVYNDYLGSNPDKTNGRALYLHRAGADFRDDLAIFGPKLSPVPLVPDPLPEIILDEASDYAVVRVNRGVRDPFAVFVKRKDQLRATNTPWVAAVTTDDAVDDVAVRGNAIYLLSHTGAPRRKVVRAILGPIGLTHREDVIPESRVVIQNLLVAKDGLFTLDLDGGPARVRRFDWDGRALPLGSLPVVGESDTAFANPSLPGVFVKLESLTMPERWYRSSANAGTWDRLPILREPPFQTVATATTRLVAKSADGTEVPLDVYHRADLKLDGSHPTLMVVYGSYGLPNLAGFLAPRLAWIEAGGILVYTHVRGGGEFGDEWHRAGQKENKQRSVDDFVACAQEVIAKGYTSPAHLGVLSQSAGGVVASMAVWQHPDMFGAAIFGSGMLQALRSEFAEGGVANVAEFGSVSKESEFHGLLATDALQHVRDDVSYPPMLFSVGANDPRVPPWDSGGVVARLQSGARTRGPILLRVDFQDGHGAGSTAGSEMAKFADYYTFAFDVLGGVK